MKFVDEAVIEVTAGKGGDGCLSFRRERFIPKGGPDGGNGGSGGDIFLVVNRNLNTLVDFRYRRLFRAKNGMSGMGRDRSGRRGEALAVSVPPGTSVTDADTGELIGDLVHAEQRLLVARGGAGGRGNASFKTSTNRAPRQFTKGQPGDSRRLQLELQLLADVGLLGLPNAGKSSLLRAVSAATPKVADYPFSTLVPSLGVVAVGPGRTFVVADIPGLIEGAATGAGLGIQFLKHLNRTRLLLHLVDISPADGADPVIGVRAVANELAVFSAELAALPRWLVLNKCDLLAPADVAARRDAILAALDWQGEVAVVSTVTGQGLQDMNERIYAALQALQPDDEHALGH